MLTKKAIRVMRKLREDRDGGRSGFPVSAVQGLRADRASRALRSSPRLVLISTIARVWYRAVPNVKHEDNGRVAVKGASGRGR